MLVVEPVLALITLYHITFNVLQRMRLLAIAIAIEVVLIIIVFLIFIV